ncbi:MAG TPA: TetR/AcrR family transcriptional regulator [Steroidobacteraceae bacterium]|nr:TetR/AcrR family transcriptional regulator [Steroidobacteraceae bacterium]
MSAEAAFTSKRRRSLRKAGRGPGRPTREQTERRNRELLDQALDLFLEKGFEATTIEAISSSLRMSRRTIYARYGDKTALFKAALQRAIEEWIVPIERLHAAESDDLEETLVRVARMWVTNLKKPAGMRLVRVANTELFRMPEIAAYLWDRTAQPTLSYLTDLFRRRLRPDAPEIADAAEAAAAFLILVVEGSVQWATWRKTPEEEFDRQIVYRTRLFLDGARCEELGEHRQSTLLRRLERLEKAFEHYLDDLDHAER